MKKTYWMILSAGMMCLAACHTEQDFLESEQGQEAEMRTEVITATVADDATKATVADGGTFGWVDGTDMIAVHTTTGYVTSTAADATGASASFSVTYPYSSTRDAFAIFPSYLVTPSAANYGQSGSALDVTLPASYSLVEVSGEATPCPMIATNTPGASWTFSQLCGLLRLTVNSIPSDATGLIIQFPGKKVNGTFSIAYPVTPGSSTIVTDTPASGEDQITVTFAKGTTSATINLPLPTGVYDDVFITPVDSKTKVAAVRHIKAGGYTAQAAHGKKLTATMVSFSVSSTKKVVFAPGNLQYIGSAANPYWKFANNQYDYWGASVGNQSGYAYVDRDLFGWGTSGWPNTGEGSSDVESWTNYQPYNYSNVDVSGTYSNNYYGYGPDLNDLTGTYANGDWGVYNAIGGYPAGTWRTPTGSAKKGSEEEYDKGEWYYLCAVRATGITVDGTPDARFTQAEINTDGSSVKGVIIFPDSYLGGTPAGVSWGTINDKSNYTTTCTSAGWKVLEDAGCLFLPAGGNRYGNAVNNAGNSGYYWSSAYHNNQYAYCMWFNTGTYFCPADDDFYRCDGMSVRLIREL